MGKQAVLELVRVQAPKKQFGVSSASGAREEMGLSGVWSLVMALQLQQKSGVAYAPPKLG